MSTIVIMPGGFHPFHAGHMALYQSALKAFPGAEVYVAATNDTKTRPFPFAIKEKLAKLAGVAPGHFIQVKSPFQPREITDKFNPEQDVVIFVRSAKDKNESPKPGGTKKDGSPAYFQPYTGKDVQPFGKHAYMSYLPTVEFGPGITSATEIRNAWPKLDDRRKTAMVMSLYPATQKNPKLAANVVKMLDMGMGTELDESWKNAIAGGAMALSALGAGAQTMPNVNAQQVELVNKYYNVLVQRAKEDGRELDRRTLNFLKAKAENAAALKIQQSSTQSQPQSQPQQGFPTQGSERKVSKDINNFESKKLNEFAPNDGGGDEKSYLLQLADDLADAMYGPNKNKQEVKNVSGKILAAGGNVKITWNDDSTFNVIMYHPTYFKQGHLIRLVGRGDELTEFAPPSSDRGDGGGGDDRSRRIRKLLEIAIQVAKQKNVDELGMIHAMNMIAGDEFFSVAVEGILPDITDKEYMFVLQSAYKTVKQGLAEGKVINTYLWHGSRQKIPMLEPKQSVDTGGAAGSNQNAIYATSDPKVAIAMGLTTAGSDTGMFPNDPQMVLFSGKIRKGEYVYLHKLPFNGPDGKPQFVQGGNSREFHSIPGVEGIKPIEIKEIPVNKYLNLIRKATPTDLKLRKKYMKKQGVAEGDVVPFKQPSKTLTWQQVPRDVLLLANDWLWAEYDNTGLDAVMDPKGFGNGTANELQYITAKLQQKGWTIDHNDENDGPDEYNLILTNKRGQTVLLSIEDAQTFSGWAKGTSSYPSLNEGPIVKRIVHPNMINIYVRPGSNKPPLLVATDIPYKIFDKYVNKAIQKYPQFKQTDFSFKSSDKINEFVTPSGGDDREPDEEILRKLAAMWWNGTIQQMKKAQQTLQAMGWDIGQDESGDDDAGVFVIRIGDEHGDSYIAFPHSELSLDDINEDYLDEN